MSKKYQRTDVFESIFNYQGQPLSYDDFPFWRDVINSDRLTTDVDQLYRQQVWKCSRQVGKSVNLGFLGVGFCLEYKNINVIITQPTDTQISKFSVQNVKPIEQQSIVIDEFYKDNKTTQTQVKNKSYTTGSRIILANIYTSVMSARGTPGSITLIDEYQDTPPKNAQIILETMRRSPIRISIRCGTPLEEENDLQRLFDQSTGCEWGIKCTYCGHWNVDLGFSNVGTKGIICEKCARRIYTRNGTWIEARPGAPIEGFHLNELCVPSDAPGATQWSKMLYDLSQNERAVQNEILGNSFSDNVHPITRKKIIELCNPKREYVKRAEDITPEMMNITFAGLDWAMETSDRKTTKELKSYTMLTIANYNTGTNRLEVVFVKKYHERLYDKPEEVIKDIVYWLSAFRVRIVGMDYGVGHKENQRIADLYGHDKCMEIQYTGEMSDGAVWHELSNKFCIGRSSLFDDTLDDMLTNGLFEFAKYEGETSNYEKDLTTIYRTTDPLSRKSKYSKSTADDWWNNLVYIRLAYLFWMRKLYYVQAL